jgi:hypothetical protein
LEIKDEKPHENPVAEIVCGESQYTPEYKQQALEQWSLSGRSAAGVAARCGSKRR